MWSGEIKKKSGSYDKVEGGDQETKELSQGEMIKRVQKKVQENKEGLGNVIDFVKEHSGPGEEPPDLKFNETLESTNQSVHGLHAPGYTDKKRKKQCQTLLSDLEKMSLGICYIHSKLNIDTLIKTSTVKQQTPDLLQKDVFACAGFSLMVPDVKEGLYEFEAQEQEKDIIFAGRFVPKLFALQASCNLTVKTVKDRDLSGLQYGWDEDENEVSLFYQVPYKPSQIKGDSAAVYVGLRITSEQPIAEDDISVITGELSDQQFVPTADCSVERTSIDLSKVKGLWRGTIWWRLGMGTFNGEQHFRIQLHERGVALYGFYVYPELDSSREENTTLELCKIRFKSELEGGGDDTQRLYTSFDATDGRITFNERGFILGLGLKDEVENIRGAYKVYVLNKQFEIMDLGKPAMNTITANGLTYNTTSNYDQNDVGKIVVCLTNPQLKGFHDQAPRKTSAKDSVAEVYSQPPAIAGTSGASDWQANYAETAHPQE